MKSLFLFVSVTAVFAATLIAGCAVEQAAEEPTRVLYQTISQDAHPVFEDVVREAADSPLLSARVTFDPGEESIADLRLDLDFSVRDKGVSMTEEVWQQTTTMLLTLYPATCGRFELELSGDLYDQNGTRLKSWYLAEQDTAFLWLFQGKDCGTEQSELSVTKIAERMLEQLYRRMAKDGVWSGKELIPVGDLPLVYVVPVNAKELVERVTKTDEPFPNFTFDPQSGKSANRTVKIQFYFNQAEQGIGSVIGRGMGAIATIGLVSMCPPNEMVISAEVLADDDTVLRSYRYAKKKRASGDFCHAPTDRTHPELAAGLLRKLFKQIQKDRVID